MKIWLAKNSEIPIKDQLVAQVLVGIAAGDLKAGDKLPSTRELARRFGIHPNTVSAAYRQLAKSGSVVKRSGSGVYIAEANGSCGDALDGLIDVLLKSAESIGYGREDVLGRLLMRVQPPRNLSGFALFEPNADLAEILIHEIACATGAAVERIEISDIPNALDRGLKLIALSDEEPKLAPRLSNGNGCVYLTANSVALTMTGHSRPAVDDIVALVSAWDDFLTFGRLFLVAAKIDPDAIVCVSSKERGWQMRLDAASFVICDSFVAEDLPDHPRLRVFPLVSSVSLEKLLALV